jgi:hypothetical protein
MDEVIKRLADTNSPVFLALIAVTFTILFLREYVSLYVKIRESKVRFAEVEARREEQRPPEAPPLESPKDVVSWNFRLLEKYYDQTLGEFRLNSRATIVVASLGFAVILIGVGFAFAGSVTVGTVSSVAGLIAEAGALMFFKQNQVMAKQVEEYHKKLVSTQYLLTAVSLTDGLSDSNREAEIHQIIVNLLFLSNELHGADSKHLFRPVTAATAA